MANECIGGPHAHLAMAPETTYGTAQAPNVAAVKALVFDEAQCTQEAPDEVKGGNHSFDTGSIDMPEAGAVVVNAPLIPTETRGTASEGFGGVMLANGGFEEGTEYNTTVEAAPSPTTTSATVASGTNIQQWDLVAFDDGTNVDGIRMLTSADGAAALTWEPALSGAPDASDNVRSGLQYRPDLDQSEGAGNKTVSIWAWIGDTIAQLRYKGVGAWLESWTINVTGGGKATLTANYRTQTLQRGVRTKLSGTVLASATSMDLDSSLAMDHIGGTYWTIDPAGDGNGPEHVLLGTMADSNLTAQTAPITKDQFLSGDSQHATDDPVSPYAPGTTLTNTTEIAPTECKLTMWMVDDPTQTAELSILTGSVTYNRNLDFGDPRVNQNSQITCTREGRPSIEFTFTDYALMYADNFNAELLDHAATVHKQMSAILQLGTQTTSGGSCAAIGMPSVYVSAGESRSVSAGGKHQHSWTCRVGDRSAGDEGFRYVEF